MKTKVNVNIIKGTPHDDELIGTSGVDHINGGRGNDIIKGAAGNDLLVGGQGNDTFVFGYGDGQDVIRDFKVGADHIILNGVDMSTVYFTHDNVLNTTIHYGADTITVLGVNDDNFHDFFGG